MSSFNVRCRAVDIEHSCCWKNNREPTHPDKLLGLLKGMANACEKMKFSGMIKSASNNFQIDFDFDSCWLRTISSAGWESQPLDRLQELEDIPNLMPDGILSKGSSAIAVEIEKSNKKTIWFDLIKLMMLINQDVVGFGLLVVPRNYAHRLGVSNLFNEARYYRYCLSRFAKVDEQLLSKIAIVGYTQEAHVSGRWTQIDSSVVKNVKQQAQKHFGKRKT